MKHIPSKISPLLPQEEENIEKFLAFEDKDVQVLTWLSFFKRAHPRLMMCEQFLLDYLSYELLVPNISHIKPIENTKEKQNIAQQLQELLGGYFQEDITPFTHLFNSLSLSQEENLHDGNLPIFYHTAFKKNDWKVQATGQLNQFHCISFVHLLSENSSVLGKELVHFPVGELTSLLPELTPHISQFHYNDYSKHFSNGLFETFVTKGEVYIYSTFNNIEELPIDPSLVIVKKSGIQNEKQKGSWLRLKRNPVKKYWQSLTEDDRFKHSNIQSVVIKSGIRSRLTGVYNKHFGMYQEPFHPPSDNAQYPYMYCIRVNIDLRSIETRNQQLNQL